MSLRFAQRVVFLVLSLPTAVLAQAPVRDAAPAPNATPAGKGVIRGAVTAADTGRPLLRAEVRIQSVGMTPPDSRAVLTDEKGRFEATALKAGRYTLSASKPGYLTLAYGQVRARESGRAVQLSETMAL